MSLFGNEERELFERVIDIIKNYWKPKQTYSNEEGYQNDLFEYLNKNNEGGHLVKKETGRGLADIAIDRKVGIELKLNFHSKSESNRLVGQVSEFLNDYNYVVVVLCGKSDTSQVNGLKSELRKIRSRYEGAGIMQSEPSKDIDLIMK